MVAVLLAGLLLAQDPSIEELIKQLSNDSLEVREKAAVDLASIGDKVEERLKKEISSAAGEVKTRCETILRKIERTRRLRRALPPLQRITIDADERQVRDVISEFVETTGIKINHDNLKSGLISVHVKEVTPLEALDAICDAAGYHYSNDVGSFSTLLDMSSEPPGFRMYLRSFKGAPRTYVRHYMIRATQVNLQKSIDFRGTESGHVSLQLELLWPPTVRPAGIWKLHVNTAADDKGNLVYDRAKDQMKDIGPEMGRRYSSSGTKQPVFGVSLRDLGRLERIASLKGEAEIRFLLDRKTLSFQDPLNQVGKTVEFDGVTICLKRFIKENGLVRAQLEVTGTPTGRTADRLPESPAALIPFDSIKIKTEDGSLPQKSGSGGGGNSLSVDWLLVNSKVTALEFEVDADYHVDSFDFELKNIPIPK